MSSLLITGGLIACILAVAIVMGAAAPEARAHDAILPLGFALVVLTLIWITLNEAGL